MRRFHVEQQPGGITEEWYSDVDGHITRKLTQKTTGLIDALGAASEFARGKNRYHVASVPITVAAAWAKECGAGIGTQEFVEYLKKKMKNGEFSPFSTGIKF